VNAYPNKTKSYYHNLYCRPVDENQIQLSLELGFRRTDLTCPAASFFSNHRRLTDLIDPGVVLYYILHTRHTVKWSINHVHYTVAEHLARCSRTHIPLIIVQRRTYNTRHLPPKTRTRAVHTSARGKDRFAAAAAVIRAHAICWRYIYLWVLLDNIYLYVAIRGP